MTEIQFLISTRDELYKLIHIQENEIKESKKKLDNIDKKIYVICNHKWIENDYCGIYDKITKTCSICNLTNY